MPGKGLRHAFCFVGEEVVEVSFEEVVWEGVGPGLDWEYDTLRGDCRGDCKSSGLSGKPPAFFGSAWKRGETCTLTLDVGGANGTGSPREPEPTPDVERHESEGGE